MRPYQKSKCTKDTAKVLKMSTCPFTLVRDTRLSERNRLTCSQSVDSSFTSLIHKTSLIPMYITRCYEHLSSVEHKLQRYALLPTSLGASTFGLIEPSNRIHVIWSFEPESIGSSENTMIRIEWYERNDIYDFNNKSKSWDLYSSRHLYDNK